MKTETITRKKKPICLNFTEILQEFWMGSKCNHGRSQLEEVITGSSMAFPRTTACKTKTLELVVTRLEVIQLSESRNQCNVQLNLLQLRIKSKNFSDEKVNHNPPRTFQEN